MSEWTSERRARAALTMICPGGDPRLRDLLGAYPPSELLERLRGDATFEAWHERARHCQPEVVIEGAEAHGLRFVIPSDDEWPSGLADLDLVEPVGGMGGAPVGLWVAGPGHLATWARRSVAIVGSRAATRYGETVTIDLAVGVARTGASRPFTVVSGGAYGIDAIAHRGAMAGEGVTIGVYANGLDEPYPKGNQELFNRLRAEHLVVSEVPAGLRPTKSGFLARNRLIAALAQGTVVVEAAARSGARNTITWAEHLNRVVMAVPGSICSATSVTPNRLIQEAVAALVAAPDDIRVLLDEVGAGPEIELLRGPDRALDLVSPQQRAVREALPRRGGISPAEAALSAGVPMAGALALLVELETLGLARESAPGLWQASGFKEHK